MHFSASKVLWPYLSNGRPQWPVSRRTDSPSMPRRGPPVDGRSCPEPQGNESSQRHPLGGVLKAAEAPSWGSYRGYKLTRKSKDQGAPGPSSPSTQTFSPPHPSCQSSKTVFLARRCLPHQLLRKTLLGQRVVRRKRCYLLSLFKMPGTLPLYNGHTALKSALSAGFCPSQSGHQEHYVNP